MTSQSLYCEISFVCVSHVLNKFITCDTIENMNKRINIGDKEKAINDICQFSQKSYQAVDIEFFNVHLKELNETCGKKIFDKNNLYVRSSTLWELMQPEGSKKTHNFHGLSAENIYEAIKGCLDPFSIFASHDSRIVVITLVENVREEKLQLIIELHASLENDRSANINKLVSIYPKKNVENELKKIDAKDVLFMK